MRILQEGWLSPNGEFSPGADIHEAAKNIVKFNKITTIDHPEGLCPSEEWTLLQNGFACIMKNCYTQKLTVKSIQPLTKSQKKFLKPFIIRRKIREAINAIKT